MNESDISLWELLGLPGPPEPEPVPDSVWEAAVAAAVDPAAAVVEQALVPDGEPEPFDIDTIELGEEIGVEGLEFGAASDDDPFGTFASGEMPDVLGTGDSSGPGGHSFPGDDF